MKKIVIIIAFMFLFMMNINAETLTRTYYDNIYFVQNDLPDYYMSDKQFHLSFDGVTAYCLDPALKITGYEYQLINLNNLNIDDDTKKYIGKLIYYGYDYPGHQDVRYYMATQALIWEKLSTYTIQFFTKQYGYGDYIDVSNEKNEILSLVNEHNNMPFFANQTYSYEHQTQIILEDNILLNYELEESNYNASYIEGNKLYINNLDNYIGQINLKFKQKTYQNKESKVYYRTGSQTMMTGGYIDTNTFTLNIHITGANVTIHKLDNDSGRHIINSGVVVNIKNINTNNYISINNSNNLIINNDGLLNLTNIPYGIYELREVQTSNDYELNNEIVYFEVKGNMEVNLYNNKKKEQIELTKYGDDYLYEHNDYQNILLPNVSFKLYALEDIITKDGITHYHKDDLVMEGITDANGNITFDNLILGSYYLQENVQEKYVNDNNIFIIDLKNDNNKEITIYNKLKKGNLVINKKDIDSNNLILNSNVIVNIKNIDSDNYLYINGSKDLHIPDNGTLTIHNIPSGNYEIKEISTNEEYLLNEETINFELKENIEINLYNQKKKGSIKITKYAEEYFYEHNDYQNILLPNVSFKLYALEDIITKDGITHYHKDDLVMEGITGANGNITFDNLILGSYYLKENVQEKYVNDNNIFIIDLKKENNQEITIYNKLKKGNLVINKKDADSNNLILNSQVVVNIKNTDSDNYLYINGSKDLHIPDNGTLTIHNIPDGNYEIKEVSTNEEYLLNEETINFELKENMEINLYNQKKKGSIKITKYAEEYHFHNYNFEPLSDVTFTLYLDNNIVKQEKTNEDGIVTFNDLDLGIYLLKEDVMNQYIDEHEEYVFDLYKINEQETDIYNILKKENLIIKKIDSLTGYPLEGVTFEVFDEEGSLGLFTTNSDGLIVIDELPLQKYQIKEISTIDGYILDEEIHEIDLNKENIITLENSKGLIIPNALSNKPSFHMAIDILIIIVVLLWVNYLKQL